MARVYQAFVVALGIALVSAMPVIADEDPQHWFRDGQLAVHHATRLSFNMDLAKNIILFVGDGMGISTVTAARILEGQMRGKNGEENQLSTIRDVWMIPSSRCYG